LNTCLKIFLLTSICGFYLKETVKLGVDIEMLVPCNLVDTAPQSLTLIGNVPDMSRVIYTVVDHVSTDWSYLYPGLVSVPL